MRLYTKTGDRGTSALYDGNRISKSSIFFDLLGSVDELSSHIGLLKVMIRNDLESKKVSDRISMGKHLDFFVRIQHILIIVSSHIATNDPSKKKKLYQIGSGDIDSRIMWKFDRQESAVAGRRDIDMRSVHVDPNILVLMNRLSDYFFALARNLSGSDDTVFRPTLRNNLVLSLPE
jgi:cob(I)alamin adenosyltransferase